MSQDPEDTRDPQYDDMPMIPMGLIEALGKRFPERWPKPGMSVEDIFYRSGQLNVLEVLAFIQTKQLEQAKESEQHVLRSP